jgi:hypothetical protein
MILGVDYTVDIGLNYRVTIITCAVRYKIDNEYIFVFNNVDKFLWYFYVFKVFVSGVDNCGGNLMR